MRPVSIKPAAFAGPHPARPEPAQSGDESDEIGQLIAEIDTWDPPGSVKRSESSLSDKQKKQGLLQRLIDRFF